MKEQSTPSIYKQRVDQSVQFLNEWNKGHPVPDIAIVLGSGLSQVAAQDAKLRSLHFSEIPGFKAPQVAGHQGQLKVGEVKCKNIHGKMKSRHLAFLYGRNHAYEGHNAAEVVHNIRALIQWGVKGVVLTNAAGCLNSNWKLGQLMLLTDHINATGLSPLAGDFGRDFGKKFVDLSACYSLSWQVQFRATASVREEELYDGVYYGVLGPQYETPAEIRMMQTLGAQAVGMSTVLEAIAARQMGAKVAGLSCLTNYAAGLNSAHLSHEEVMEMGRQFASTISDILMPTVMELGV